jgi:demethylmenaquinone methyltransferase/2-methoxy-6-polyprenyl-1,4-benzoquinol methylase/phosphoethanolamine N-methyltransferase
MRSAREAAPATKGVRIRWPRWYDALNRLHFLGREDQFREKTVEIAGIECGQSVLDVGCGTGNLTMAAKARAGAEGEVHGNDAAPEMIRQAERKAAEVQLDIRYKTALIEDIPYPDHTFNVVLSSLMLHHLPRDLKRKGIAEISRVLKPSGRFFAVDVDPPLMGNLRTVEEAMEANGFIDIRRDKMKFRTLWIPIHYLPGTRAPPD